MPARAQPGVRPRYRRITAALSAAGTTAVAVLGGLGALPVSSSGAAAEPMLTTRTVPPPHARSQPSPPPVGRVALADATTVKTQAPTPVPPPARSGHGRRVVFDISEQRVWLVAVDPDGADRVRRSYLASGSLTDNLHPGTYAVQARERHAWGIDDSGTMQYFVVFTHGKHAAIGFHDIPVKDGKKLQTRGQLGTPQSHGCIRQWRPDAKALWRFAPVGTTVVVVA